MGAYELHFHHEALREWHQLDAGIRARLKKKLAKRIENPIVDSARLSGALAGLFVIRSHTDGVRLVYEVDSENKTVIVSSVGKREDLIAYKNAIRRSQI